MSSTFRALKPYAVFNAVTIDSTKYSDSTDTTGLLNLEYDVVWSGGSSLNGAITIEALLAKPDDNPANWVWQTLDLGSTISLSGASGSHTIVFTVVPMTLVRLKYTSTAGTATLTAVVKGKGW